MINRIYKWVKKLFGKKDFQIAIIPERLMGIIDRYDDAALLTKFSTEEPVILYANKKHKKLTGYTTEEVVGNTPKKFQGKNTSEKTKIEMRNELSKASFWHGNVINYRKNGEETEISLVIFAISYEGRKFYVALKTLVEKT